INLDFSRRHCFDDIQDCTKFIPKLSVALAQSETRYQLDFELLPPCRALADEFLRYPQDRRSIVTTDGCFQSAGCDLERRVDDYDRQSDGCGGRGNSLHAKSLSICCCRPDD